VLALPRIITHAIDNTKNDKTLSPSRCKTKFFQLQEIHWQWPTIRCNQMCTVLEGFAQYPEVERTFSALKTMKIKNVN
jgi:hypothetical protein